MDLLLSIAIASLAAAISPALAMAVFILAFGGQLFDPWMLVIGAVPITLWQQP